MNRAPVDLIDEAGAGARLHREGLTHDGTEITFDDVRHRIDFKALTGKTVRVSVGSVLQPAGFENAQGLLSAAYAKDGADPQWNDDPGMKKWSAFIDKYMPGANRSDGNLVYGYGVAQTLVETLRLCGDDLTRANVMKQAASLKDFTPDTLLPGVKINTSATDFAPLSELQMMRFKGEKWELFGDIIRRRGRHAPSEGYAEGFWQEGRSTRRSHLALAQQPLPQ